MTLLPLTVKVKARKLAAKQAYVPVILPVDFSNGLAQLRSHGRRGIRSIGLTSNRNDAALKSRFCLPWLVDAGWQTNNLFIESLLELGQVLQGKGFLSVSSEQFIDTAAQYQHELKEVFTVPVDFKLIQSLTSKGIQARAASQVGLSVPASVSMDQGVPFSQVDLNHLTFPVFVRALDRSKEFYAEWGLQGVVAENPRDLRAICAQFGAYSLLVQDFIDDEGRKDFCVSGLALRSGEVLIYSYSVVRHVRRFGSSSMGISLPPSVVQPKVEAFLKRTGYVGPFDILFMQPKGDAGPFFTEMNMRFWKSHGLAQKCGLDLPYIQVEDARGALSDEIVNCQVRVGVRWWLIFTDLAICWRDWRSGRLTWKEFRRSIGLPFVSGIGSWDDPLPEIYNFASFRWAIPLGAKKG